MQEQDRLSNRALFGYGISAAPVIYAYVLILIMYMKFASVQLGISTAVIGTIFLAAKVWDAVTDPMVGFLSDRTKSRFGRRRPWILASAPLLALFSIMAWAPPESLEGTQLIVWITVSIFGFYTAYTLFEVPHMSLGAEISIKATERNRVFGFRQALKVLGMGVAFIVGSAVIESGVGPTRTMAYILGAMTLLLIFGGVSMLPAERAEYQGRGPANPIEAVRDVFSNPHARLLLLVVFIDAIGVGGIGALTPFVVDYVVGEPQMIPALLGANMGASLLSIPVWIRLSRHFEKRRLLLYSMLGRAVGYGLIFFVGEGDWHIVLVSSLIAGCSGGCPNSLGYTLKSEIIDFDDGIKKADAIMMLRVQNERHQTSFQSENYNEKFGLNTKRLKMLSEEQLIFHPGPFNEGVEITRDVVNDKRSQIWKQVENGVFLRMAVLANMLGGKLEA